MTLVLVKYFLAGLLQDVLWTLNVQAVSKSKVLSASIIAFINTVLGMYILYDILDGLDGRASTIAILVYALGISFGTVVGMHLEMYLTKRRKMGKKTNVEKARQEAELGISPLL